MIELRFRAPAVTVGKRCWRAWSTNDDRTMHWSVRRRLVAAWRQAAFVAARQAGVTALGPCVIEIAIPFARNARRDPMNYVGTVLKAVIDGLQADAGLWPDDTAEWVTITQPLLELGEDCTIRLLPRPVLEAV